MSWNALRQIHLKTQQEQISGFSISGLATYVQIPELDACFDMGECPLSAVPLNHVFLTHAHGDHSRCLMRHHSLRKMTGLAKEAVYYLPADLVELAKRWIHAEALFEGVAEHKIMYPHFVGINAFAPAIPLMHRKDLRVSAFPVKHSVLSLGYTLYNYKKKLKEEYLGLTGEQLVAIKAQGTLIQREEQVPKLTFIGDCTGDSLLEQEHIWQSPILFLECTFLDDDELIMARKKGHTHISEIVQALETFAQTMQVKYLILKHFSMKYPREYIFTEVARKIPAKFRDLVLLMV
jgi:ribonuclease Z